ncbi:MAG: carbamoyl-phosphate synthase large subunit [Rhodobacteraceae bacterium]|nr:carbamoyl-phosphate synthase large subunit [Paracoccaceae bacterium]
MTVTRLLIANRGEIAARIARTAAEMGVETVAIHSADDAASLHVRRADRAVEIPGQGARAYLDAEAVVAAAVAAGADAVHPGYGFLSENVDFARRVEAAGLAFVGPTPESLALFGDKVAAKRRAGELGVPTIPGTAEDTDLPAALAFFDALPEGAAMMIKAVAGGGGRGMRAVFARAEVEQAWTRCKSEAQAAFGDGAVYVERFLPAARHLEVQILGDGQGGVTQLAERECTLQRRNQKLIEIAPSPALSDADRARIAGWAVEMARSGDYRSLGTFEFLMDAATGDIFFIEANPRIQVEHTVTEEIFGLDLVRLQLGVAEGRRLSDLGAAQDQLPAPRGFALQARVNMERMDAKGNARPSGGTLTAYEQPAGAGIRVDGFAYAGYRTSAAFDSLLAKVVVHSPLPDFAATLAKADRALKEFRIEGLATNLPWLRALLAHPAVRAGDVTTRFIEAEAQALFDAAAAQAPALFFEPAEAGPDAAAPEAVLPAGAVPVTAPMQATLFALDVAEGDRVRAGQQLGILEAMKMEHTIAAPSAGVVTRVFAALGDTLMEGAPLFAIDPAEDEAAETAAEEAIDLDYIRPELEELRARLAAGLDETRPKAVEKRRARGHQTARENLGQLCDADSFNEYGALAVAAQKSRRSLADLIENTTGDGIVTGTGTINGDLFGPDKARCAFAVYDYMVLAATQGQRNHKKQDRLFGLAGKWSLPVVLLAEGGGGRPGDDRHSVAGLDNKTFSKFAALSGQVPLVGVVSGRCFAGNAALLGCCDVIIADESANIGMAGPAMIEGGGLGVYASEEIGPIASQSVNGVVDIRVKDEAEACAAAKKYLSYFQGPTTGWTAADQRLLRRAIPENRLRVHEVRDAIDILADEGSVLELRREFGVGIVTAFIRIEGKPFGLIANNTKHLGGAIDGPAADKASRFMQLCDAFDIPIVSLVDTPGFMVGPEAEKTGLVRHVCRMFVTAASLSVPVFAVVLRKGYGLGAMAMTGGGFHDGFFTVSWPTGEFGGMGLEGAVRLGFRKELDAETDPAAKQALYEKLVAGFYEIGKAVSVASALEIDAVIDPVETRGWILRGLAAAPPRQVMAGGRRPFVDSW